MLRPLIAGMAFAVLATVLSGCDSKDPGAQASSDSGPKAPAAVGKGDVAVIVTNLGTIKFQLWDDKAPKTVANFEKLAGQKFYDGTAFHRVMPGFMIQGGDPNTKTSDARTYGQGGPGYPVDDEFGDTDFVPGVVAMANASRPNSGGSQFFIMVGSNPSLNGKYSAFGKVTEGMDVTDKIVHVKTNGEMVADINSARIISVTIIPGPSK